MISVQQYQNFIQRYVTSQSNAHKAKYRRLVNKWILCDVETLSAALIKGIYIAQEQNRSVIVVVWIVRATISNKKQPESTLSSCLVLCVLKFRNLMFR